MGKTLYNKIFLWMFAGLLITFISAYFTSTNIYLLSHIYNSVGIGILIILELAVVSILSVKVRKMSPTPAKILFCFYSIINGLTFASIFVLYELESIIYIFLIAASLFAIFAILGYTTNINLLKFSTIIFMLLIGIVIVSILNIFIGSSSLDFIISIVGLVLFLGTTAYDIQKVKYYEQLDINEDNKAILCALDLYLDYINIFIRLINLFGKKRD